MAKHSLPKWKEGAANASAHEVYASVVSTQHGGDWRIYAEWIKRQPDMLAAVKTLRDRQVAWDLLIGIEPGGSE